MPTRDVKSVDSSIASSVTVDKVPQPSGVDACADDGLPSGLEVAAVSTDKYAGELANF